MRKRTLLVPCLLLAVLLPALAEGLLAGAPRTASVLYFDNTSAAADWAWLSKGFADMVSGDLAAGGGLKLVERADLEKVLKEQELALSGLLDPAGAPQVGKLLNASILVYGSYVVVPGTAPRLRADAKAVDAESGAVLAAASAEGAAADALALERALSARLAAALGVPAGASPELPRSAAAAAAYYRGVDLLDAGNYNAALDAFGKALAMEPSFLKPGKGIEEAYRFLKDFRNQRLRREMNVLAADIRDLSARIGSTPFYSFADAAMNPAKFGFKDAQAAADAYRARPNVWNGNSPVQAIWYLQNLYGNLGDLAKNSFADAVAEKACDDEILRWGAAAEKAYPKDEFLPEAVYRTVFVHVKRGDWQSVKAVCERLMTDWPDYRMMWAVEEYYEKALAALKG